MSHFRCHTQTGTYAHSAPKQNRALAFDGRLLHGVVRMQQPFVSNEWLGSIGASCWQENDPPPLLCRFLACRLVLVVEALVSLLCLAFGRMVSLPTPPPLPVVCASLPLHRGGQVLGLFFLGVHTAVVYVAFVCTLWLYMLLLCAHCGYLLSFCVRVYA